MYKIIHVYNVTMRLYMFVLSFSCISDIGKIRDKNEDNYCFDNAYYDGKTIPNYPLTKKECLKRPLLLGVFDGMGGEQCGKVAALLAAQTAASFHWNGNPEKSLSAFTRTANQAICDFAKNNAIRSMGTTEALLLFGKKKVMLCNVGDSRIYRFSCGKLGQISFDHVSVAIQGHKAPLLQHLGIPEEEMVLEPYFREFPLLDGDRYLIASDGLTDVVAENKIQTVLARGCDAEIATAELVRYALDSGGRDNVTVIIADVQNRRFSLKGWA